MTQALAVYRRSELEEVANGCLHRVKAIWIDGADDTSDEALLGQGFHKIKHCYIERLAADHLTQDADEAKLAFVEGVAMAQIPARLIPELRQLWMFHAEKFEFDPDRFIVAETAGSEGQVSWTPDLVQVCPENGLEIVDDKSGWQPPMTEEELKGLFQARVYSRLARDRFPNFSRYYFTIYAIRFNVRVTVSFTPDELDAVDVEIAAAIATIEHAKATNEWPAIPGPSCRFCTLACPIADNKLLLPKRLSVEQWQKLGAWLLPAEKQMREFKKAMKQGCAVYGPCDVNGVVWDNRPVLQRSYPITEVLSVLKARSIFGAFDADGAAGNLTISHSALSRLMKSFPALQDDLLPFQQTKTTYRFSARKPGVNDEDDDA